MNCIHFFHLTYYQWHSQLIKQYFKSMYFFFIPCLTLLFCSREISIFLHTSKKKKEYRNTQMKYNVRYLLKRYLPWWCPRSSSFLGLFGTGMSLSSTSSVSWWPWPSARWWPWPSARWWSRSPRRMRSFYFNKKRVFFNEIKCYSKSKFIQVHVHCTSTIFEIWGMIFHRKE